MSMYTLSLEDLKEILRFKAKDKGIGKGRILEFIREMALKYDYVPLAPYHFVQYTMGYLQKCEKNPLRFLEDLAFIMLNQPSDYVKALDEEQRKFLRLLRWSLQVLNLQVTAEGNLCYELANVIDEYVMKTRSEAEAFFNAIKERRIREEFRKTGYRKPVLLVDILTSTGFAKCTHIFIPRSVRDHKFIRPTLQTMLLPALAPLQDFPSQRIGEEIARIIVRTGIESRRLIVKCFKEGIRIPQEVYAEVRDYVTKTLNKGLRSSYITGEVLSYALTSMFEDVIATRIFLSEYGIMPLNIVDAITLFKF